MPIETIQRQPVIFNEIIDSCNLGTRDLPNLVDSVDLTYFQFKITPCDSAPQLLANPTFSTVSDWIPTGVPGWAIGLGDNAVYINDGSSQGSYGYGLYQDNVLERGKLYEIVVDIEYIEANDGLGVLFYSPETTYGFPISFGTVNTPGKHKLYAISQGTSFYIAPLNTTSTLRINQIEVREVDMRLKMLVQDCDGNNLYQWRLSDYLVEVNLNFVFGIQIPIIKIDSDVFELKENYVVGAVSWLGEADGCYRICLADPCINTNSQLYIYNGEFNDNSPATQGWILENFGGDSWEINNNVLRFFLNLQDGISFGTARQEGVLGIGVTYNYEINISSIGFAAVTITYGTQSVIYSTTGTHSGTITSDGVDFEIKVKSKGQGPGTSSAVIDYIRHEAILEDIEPELCSNKFEKCEKHDCTKLLHLCNQEDSFGFKFGGSFIPSVRVPARLVNPYYEYNDILKEDSSLGRRSVIYGENRVGRILKIGAVPSRIHDFLSLSLISDDFFINNKEYSVDEEEYEVIYSDRREDIGYIHLQVSEKTQNYRNVKCDASTEVCYLPPNHLLSGDGASVISGGSGVAIKLGG